MTKAETYIAFIKDFLRKGEVQRINVLSKFVKKYQVDPRTFDRYWKKAQESYSNELLATEKAKADIAAQEAKSVVKRDIIDKYERLEILSKMAKGIGRKVGEELIIPTDHDRRGAIDLINKMEGLYNDKSGTSSVTVNITHDGIELQSDEI
jgi:hypothetical protein